MKFQNCILINFEWMHGWMVGRNDGHTQGQVESNLPFNSSKVGGIKNRGEQ